MGDNQTAYYEVLVTGNYEDRRRIVGEKLTLEDYSEEFLEWNADKGNLRRVPFSSAELLAGRVEALEAKVQALEGQVGELLSALEVLHTLKSEGITVTSEETQGTPEAPAEQPASPAPEPDQQPDQQKAKATSTSLPDDFPERNTLIAAGLDSVEKIQQASDDELKALQGIGPAKLKLIRSHTQTGG